MIAMYNSLRGILSAKDSNTSASFACLDIQGVEYILEISRTCFMDLPNLGEELRLLCYLQVREDQMYLLGFLKEEERLLFLDLLKVEGIGPKQALKILSGMQAKGLGELLEAGDVDGLERIPGLGKKTAQKMVLALKGKLSLDSAFVGTGKTAKEDLGAYEDLAQALVNMGYDRKSCVEVLKRIIPEYADLEASKKEQELLRRAIVELS